MDRNEYCDRVLAQVGRLTSGEARDLRAELSGHIEDHAEALTALGYGEDEAGERAVMLMGDPEETGRALRRCYRGWWLVLARYLMVTVTAVLCVLIANEMVKSPRISDSDRYRAREQRFHWIELWGSETLNVQIPIGNDIVCVDRVSTGIAYDQIRGAQLAVVQMRDYDRIPGGVVYKRLLQELRLENQRGEVFFEGKDVAKLSKTEMRHMRKDMQIIFQDPYSSLDPKKTINQIISEPIRLNKILTNKHQIEDRVLELMDTVGLAERLINSYPHELDGGRRQRIGIARALAMEPKLIVCDEPVSALDVSIQAQILNLLKELQQKMGLTYIFITHDLSVVNHFSDEIAVMYLGSIVEKAPSEELFANPIHPYTKALLSAIPIPDLHNKRQRISLKGEITSPINLPDECRFANRCFECEQKCRAGIPPLVEVSPNHFVACFNHGV